MFECIDFDRYIDEIGSIYLKVFTSDLSVKLNTKLIRTILNVVSMYSISIKNRNVT